jgi:Cof subfamily protein (haloacid dehalogenase superfamily)
MGYRLIALDIDGTIRKADYPPSERTHRAIEAAKEAGAVVTLVTGRMFRSALAATSELNITSPIVSFQGVHVAHPKTAEVLYHLPLEPHMSIRALDELDGWPREILAYIGDDVYANVLTPWVEAYSERNKGGVQVVSDLRTLAADRPTRLAVLGDENEIGDLDARLSAALDGELYVTRSLPTLCEILHPDGGKHRGLQWLAGHLGIPREQTVACGNGYEDVEMLRWAGLGVASDEAVPKAKEAADVVARPIEEDGVALVIEDLLDRCEIG